MLTQNSLHVTNEIFFIEVCVYIMLYKLCKGKIDSIVLSIRQRCSIELFGCCFDGNTEMQTTNSGNLPLRSRYYQAQIDASLLVKGEAYDTLNASYVIFIYMKNVFGRGRPIYTFENRCIQETDIALGDKSTKIFLNPYYKVECVSPELANFLKFLTNGKPVDEYTERLVEAVEAERNNEYLNVE